MHRHNGGRRQRLTAGQLNHFGTSPDGQKRRAKCLFDKFSMTTLTLNALSSRARRPEISEINRLSIFLLHSFAKRVGSRNDRSFHVSAFDYTRISFGLSGRSHSSRLVRRNTCAGGAHVFWRWNCPADRTSSSLCGVCVFRTAAERAKAHLKKERQSAPLYTTPCVKPYSAASLNSSAPSRASLDCRIRTE